MPAEPPESGLPAGRAPPPGPERRFARLGAAVCFGFGLWWWWHGLYGGAFWVIGALVLLAVGETAAWVLRPVNLLWVPLEMLAAPLTRPVAAWLRALAARLPPGYLGANPVRRPLSLKELDAALNPDKPRLEQNRPDRPADGETR